MRHPTGRASTVCRTFEMTYAKRVDNKLSINHALHRFTVLFSTINYVHTEAQNFMENEKWRVQSEMFKGAGTVALVCSSIDETSSLASVQ